MALNRLNGCAPIIRAGVLAGATFAARPVVLGSEAGARFGRLHGRSLAFRTGPVGFGSEVPEAAVIETAERARTSLLLSAD